MPISSWHIQSCNYTYTWQYRVDHKHHRVLAWLNINWTDHSIIYYHRRLSLTLSPALRCKQNTGGPGGWNHVRDTASLQTLNRLPRSTMLNDWQLVWRRQWSTVFEGESCSIQKACPLTHHCYATLTPGPVMFRVQQQMLGVAWGQDSKHTKQNGMLRTSCMWLIMDQYTINNYYLYFNPSPVLLCGRLRQLIWLCPPQDYCTNHHLLTKPRHCLTCNNMIMRLNTFVLSASAPTPLQTRNFSFTVKW